MALQSGQLTSAITAGQLTFQLTNLSANAQTALPSIGALPQPMGVPMLIDGGDGDCARSRHRERSHRT